MNALHTKESKVSYINASSEYQVVKQIPDTKEAGINSQGPSNRGKSQHYSMNGYSEALENKITRIGKTHSQF